MICVAAFACGASSDVRAEQFRAIIHVLPGSPGRAVVEGSCSPTRVWSFRNTYGAVSELGNRIEQLKLFDNLGRDVSVRKLAPGEFESEARASVFRYEVNLGPPARASDAARVSWLSADRGLLMLFDLLPTFAESSDSSATGQQINAQTVASGAKVRFVLTDGWDVYSAESSNTGGEFEVTNPSHGVFVVGSHLRVTRAKVSGITLTLVESGEWSFTGNEAIGLAGRVVKAHAETFRSVPREQATIILLPFPEAVAADKWSAETRGQTVTLLLGKQPSKPAALSQLTVPLTHELFHLWVPNGLALSGDYDWFYEGFTLYQAARTAVRLELLIFPDFLNAISRAYDAYAAGLDRDRWSLIEASRRRWTAGESVVYQKSMLIALLYDLRLRSQSHGKHSLDDVYSELFYAYHSANLKGPEITPTEADGNSVVIATLNRGDGMRDFGDFFIRRPVGIDLKSELAPFGLRVERIGLRTHISVNERLSRRQRDLLRELGYNDY